jgi:hypothetical protein
MLATPLTSQDIQDWLYRSTPTKPGSHLPHRIRVLWANLASLDQRLHSAPEPTPTTPEQITRRRCETDAIWEGRISALRWLIEFIRVKPSTWPDSCSAEDFADYAPFPSGSDAAYLADLWTSCTKATSHSTHNSGHTPLDNAAFDRGRELICAHLNATIYKNTGTSVEEEALLPT